MLIYTRKWLIYPPTYVFEFPYVLASNNKLLTYKWHYSHQVSSSSGHARCNRLFAVIHTNDSVAMRWKTFMITRNLSLSEFGVLEAGRGDCSLHYDVGDFSCLYGRMELRRHLGYFLINKYAPSSLIVIMSFVSFWMPPKAYPARVTLSVTSLLTIVTQQYQASMPGVSYVVALNVWMIVCITFVFLGLVECAFVVTCDERDNARANGKDSWWPRPALIDHCARILFPGALLLHAFVYWGVYWRE